jgi:hypothetical protein
MGNAIAALSEADRAKFIDPATGTEMEQAADPQPLLEWLAENYQQFGATLEFVTSKLRSICIVPTRTRTDSWLLQQTALKRAISS